MDAPLPEDWRAESVSSAAMLDGRPVSVRRVAARGPLEVHAASLRERWSAEGTRFVETRRGDWLLMSVREPGGWRTIQLRATDAGVEGLETRWRDEAPRENGRPAAPPVLGWLAPDAQVLRRIDHRDPGRDAATVVAIVDEDARRAADRLRAHAGGAGFVADPAVGGPAQGAAWYRGRPDGSGEAIALRRRAEEVVATVAPHPRGAAVVLHWSRAR